MVEIRSFKKLDIMVYDRTVQKLCKKLYQIMVYIKLYCDLEKKTMIVPKSSD